MSEFADEIVTAHTAGWAWKDGKHMYFYGLGVPADYTGKVPEGFELREFPGATTLFCAPVLYLPG